MEVILLEKVANLGNIGDRVKVRSGFGRNFLLPQGKATLATPDNIARFEARRAELERVAREHLSSAEELTRAGFQVERSEVRLPHGPLRMLGEHAVNLHLHADVDVPVQVTIVAEE